ncbi:MAG TPA: YidC/Oxa1 family membrane protein insertase [Acidimicrobiales bacterium]|nr:YidC/Oxa1 family membrane protein insertase [Acidimicrobiales bacterium]
MFDFLAGVLAELYKIWPSFGGAIILFTTLVMLVLSPLSIKSTRSMIAMQRVGPEIKKLQAKHKGDREALNKEMMAFYQENNINPFSSCLPMLLQIPVFIVLYQVLIGLTRRSAGPGSNFDPKYLEGEDTPLAVALRATNEMVSFGMDLSQSAWATVQGARVTAAIPYVVLVVLVVLTAVVQQRQIQGRNPSATANPQQQMIAKVMPFIFVPISVSLPAGVVIYFVVSNVVRIGQQALVTRMDFRNVPGQEGAGDKKTERKTKATPAAPSNEEITKGNGKGPKGAGNAKHANAKQANAKGGGAKKAGVKGGNARGPNGKGANAKGANAKKADGKGVNGSRPNGQNAKPPTPVAPRPRKRKKKRR